MVSLPGSLGFSILGDKSIEFYRDPKKFVETKIQETSSDIFQSRLLNVPTVFICSYAGTYELLHEKSSDFNHGYRDFLYNSYGDNILFEDGEAASSLRACMEPVLKQSPYCDRVIDRTCKDFLDTLSDRKTTVNVYEEFKALMTRLCLELFLGFTDPSSETSKTIAELATLHWHGIISMPVRVKIPFAGESGWRKALQAKEELLKHIRETITKTKMSASQTSGDSVPASPNHSDSAENFSPHGDTVINKLLRAPFRNSCTDVEQHILLFISALIPKAFASLITSFILELAGNDKAELREMSKCDAEFHRRALLEVQRLWPPFFGGRRIAKKTTTIGKYKIPKGHAAVYISYLAHRDVNAFTNPDKFNPDRWKEDGPCRRSLFTFGGGNRCCVGTRLIEHILLYLTKSLLEKYSWSVTDSQDTSFAYKLLPVARPETLPLITFYRKPAAK